MREQWRRRTKGTSRQIGRPFKVHTRRLKGAHKSQPYRPRLRESIQYTDPLTWPERREQIDDDAFNRLAKFLGPAWSDKRVHLEVKGTDFASTTKEVRIPQLSDSSVFQGLPDVERFRLYRQGLWHESQHVKFSQPAFDALKYLQRDADYGGAPVQPILNIFEDRRITNEGLKTWGGMESEQQFMEEYGRNIRPPISARNWMKPMGKVEALLQKHLLGQVKVHSDIGPNGQAHVDRVIQPAVAKMNQAEAQVEKAKTNREKKQIIEQMVKDVIDILDLKTASRGGQDLMENEDGTETLVDYNKPVSQQQAEMSRQNPHRGQEAGVKTREKMEKRVDEAEKQRAQVEEQLDEVEKAEARGEPVGKGDRQRLEKALEEAGEKVQTAKDMAKGNRQVHLEWEDVAKGVGPGTLPPGVYLWDKREDPEKYRNRPLARRLEQQFGKLKSGVEYAKGRRGAEVDVEAYIEGRQPMLTPRTIAPERKVMFIVDGSGSTESIMDDYKKALIAVGTGMQRLGFETSMYGFTGNVAYKFKDKREQFSRVEHRIASFQSRGNTPLGQTMNRIEPDVAKQRPDTIIVLTDGGAQDRQTVATMNRRFKTIHHATPIALHIGSESEAKKIHAGLGFDKVVAVEPQHLVTRLPKQAITLAGGEE